MQHEAYLALLSKQNNAQYKKLTPKPKSDKPPPEKKEPEEEEEDDGIDETKAPRSLVDGCEKSKLNLTALIRGNDPLASKMIENTAIRLLESLYGNCDFYQKGAAQAIVKQMIKDKIESFEELKLKNPEYNKIYYKMLQGTSSGYPALSEYFSLNNKNPKPIYFRYATKTVLKAALGEKFAAEVFELERKRWEKNHRCKVMVKEDFLNLAKTKHGMDEMSALALIDFENKNKGASQVHFDSTGKIRAFHSAEKADR